MASGQLRGEVGEINLSSSMTVVKKKKKRQWAAVLAASALNFLCLCSRSEN